MSATSNAKEISDARDFLDDYTARRLDWLGQERTPPPVIEAVPPPFPETRKHKLETLKVPRPKGSMLDRMGAVENRMLWNARQLNGNRDELDEVCEIRNVDRAS